MFGHIASGFDNYIVLIYLPGSNRCTKIGKISRKLKKFKAGSGIEDKKEIPKDMKFVWIKRDLLN